LQFETLELSSIDWVHFYWRN